ncbi:MAG TPA: glycosyltransferase [Acetobacteraceae bacterium]|jgi:glycosyltransferase involved in cell wall biosynthesis
MPLQLGIGIITYNRKAVLSETLDRVRRHTRYPFTAVGVADDGSTDGTLDMLRARNMLTVTGRNMGIAWNKNRALFMLTELQRCDVVILLEDDSYPTRDHWEIEWLNAAIRWGHATIAGDWMQSGFLSGAGTADDPIRSTLVTAQCAVYSREAILFGGYYDSRFRGYGHEHVEHSLRMVRLGYGGADEEVDGAQVTVFKLLKTSMQFAKTTSFFDQAQADRNYTLARQLLLDATYRAPWHDEAAMQQFRDEMRSSFPRALL